MPERDPFPSPAREREEDVMKRILFTAVLSAAMLAGLGISAYALKI